MKIVFIVLISIFLSACSGLSTTLLIGPRYIHNTNTTEIAGSIITMKKFKQHGVCGHIHQSVVNKGPPFNNKDEVVTEHAGCGFTWGDR